MQKQKQQEGNTAAKVQLAPRTHLFIGSYLFSISLCVDLILTGFTANGSPISFLTADLLELIILVMTGLGVVLAITALFWGHRRHVRAHERAFWNGHSKKMGALLLLGILLLYALAYFQLNSGEEQQIIPSLLLGYALLLVLINFSKRRTLYFFSFLSFLMGILSFGFAGIGFKCLFLLGLSHMVFGFFSQKKHA